MIPEFKNSRLENTFKALFLGKGFDNLPVGAMIVDRNMKIAFVNKVLSGYFASDQYDIEGVSLGYALRCGTAENREGTCGLASGCKKCVIRRLISDIYEKTAPVSGVEYQYISLKAGVKQVRWFRLGGSQIVCEDRTYALLSFEDITTYKQRETQLVEKLKLDLATETLNKYSLAEYINRLGKPGRTLPFTICMADLDDFKKINDYYGHITGDKVLTAFSEISRKIIRPSDIIGRYGGEEFVFIFMDIDQKEASNIIRRIQSELKTHFSDILEYPVTFSAGLMYVGEYQWQDRQYTDLIDQVDKLLYKAKGSGKNCVVTSDCSQK